MPCDARSFCDLFKRKGPTQRLKTAKKSFLRPLWTPNPNFWYLIFCQVFFSSKHRRVGCPERCHVMSGLYAIFSNGGEPAQRLKTGKKPILRPFWNPFWPLTGSSWFAIRCLGLTQPFQTPGIQSVAQNGQKIGILSHFILSFLVVETCEQHHWAWQRLKVFNRETRLVTAWRNNGVQDYATTS